MKLNLILLIFLLIGCTKPSFQQSIKNKSSLTYSNTSKIVIKGTENNVGPSVQVQITETFLIQKIWDSIYSSRPYEEWCLSGYIVVEMYCENEKKPSIILYVNESSATHSNFDDKRFRCPGLYEMILGLLQQQSKKMNNDFEPKSQK